MTVSNISPADGYLIEHGDSISFDLDDGGTVPTSIVLTVEGVVVYTLATGFATGYTGTTTKVSNVYTITVNKTGGWDSSPIEVEAAWTISGTPSTETWSYQLRTEAVYNNLMQPRNPVSVGRLVVTEAGAAVATDAGWIDIVGATVTPLGSGKVRITFSGGSGGGAFWNWDYEAGGGAPSSGKFTADSDLIASISSISLNDTSGAGPVIQGAGASIKVGDYIAIKNETLGLHATYQVISVANPLGYWTYGVVYANGVGPTLTDTVNYEFDFLSTAPAQTSWTFSDSLTASDPGPGVFKYNNATFGSISYIYIDDTDANGTDYSDVFATLAQDDFIIVNDTTDSSKSAVFKITFSGAVDSGGRWSINVTPISGTIPADGNYQDIRIVRQSVAGTDTQGVDQWTLIGVAGETPVAQQASFDAASGGSVTSIKLSYQSDAYNLDDWLKTWSAGDFLVIKDTASSKHLVKEIASVTDDPGNSLITIVVTEMNSSGTFGGTETLDVIYESRGSSDIGVLANRTLGNTTIGVTSSGAFDTNNPTPAAVTAIRINVLGDLLGFLDTPTQAGTLKLTSVLNPSNYIIYDVTAVSDVPSYGKDFTVAYRGASAGFAFSGAYSVMWLGDAVASDISMERIAGSTYSTVQELQDIFHSSGLSSGGVIADAGSGQITVTAGTGFIRATDDALDTLLYFDFPNLTATTITDQTVRYVGVEYNAGTPQVVVRTTDVWDNNTEFRLGTVARDGTTLHISQASHQVGDHAGIMIERGRQVTPLARDNRTGGLALGEDGANRYVTVTAGGLWEGLSRYTITAFDTDPLGAADAMTRIYRDGVGGWTYQTAQTTWNNTQYDDGSGTLATMTNNRYAVHYFYVTVDGDLCMQYGQAEYTSAALAEDDAAPAVPFWFKDHAKLVGRIIFLKSASAATSIQSSFDSTFTGGAVTDHGALSGLGDDDHTQYAQTLSGAGVPGAATGNGYRVGTTYADTTNDVGYVLVDATTNNNVWSGGAQVVYATTMGKIGGPTTTNWYTSILGLSFDNDADWDDVVGANTSSDPVTDYVDYIDGSLFTAPFAGKITNIRLSVRPLVAQDWTFITFRQQWSGAAGTFTEISNSGSTAIGTGWNDVDLTPSSLTTLAKGDSIGFVWTISDAAPTASDLSARIYITFEAT